MKLGFACLIETNDKFEKEFYKVNRTLTVAKASKMTEQEVYNKCQQLTRQNIDGLYNVMKYNVDNGIKMHRLSSDMICLDNHILNTYDWKEDKCVLNLLEKIKQMAINNNIRLSFHPDMYCVLNSESEDVVNNSIDILKSHNDLCEILEINTLILHIGGKVGGIEQASQRFINGFNKLPKTIQNKIVLENEQKNFNVENTLKLCQRLGLRMCVDFAHDKWNTSTYPVEHYIYDIIKTWEDRGIPKCHLSSQDIEESKKHKHAYSIDVKDFEECLRITNGKFDIMLEVKNKQLSVLNLKKLYNL